MEQKSLERTALINVMLTSFMVTFMGSAVNLSLPSIGQEFGSSVVLTGWVVTSYLLASAAFLLPIGRLADIVGRRRVYLIGVVGFAIFTFLCTFSASMKMFIGMRVLQGVASSMIFGTGMAILTSVFPPERRGQALGWSVSVTYLGLSVGPVLGGVLNHQLGWRSIFYFTVLLGATAAAFTLTRLQGEWAGARGERFDWGGSLLYMLGLTALLLGMSTLTASSRSAYLLAGGALLLAVFVVYELRVDQPVLQVGLLARNHAFAFSNLAAMIHYSATFAVSFLMSIYLQTVQGYSSQLAGFILLSQPLIMAVFSPVAGRLSDRVEPRLVASLGMGLTTLGLFCFVFLGMDTSPILLVANLAMMGLGFALFSSPNSNAVMGSVDRRTYGIASSILGTMRLVGQATSMAIVTLLIGAYVGQQAFASADTSLLLTGTRVAFIVFTGLGILGVWVSLVRGESPGSAIPKTSFPPGEE